MLQQYNHQLRISFCCTVILLLCAIPAFSQGSDDPQPVITLKLKILGSTPENAVIAPPDEVIGTRAIEYPESALKDRTEGKVRLKVLFGSDGSIMQTETLDNGNDVRLLRAAVEGIQGTSFKPGTIDDQATEMWVEVNVRFEIDYHPESPDIADMEMISFASAEGGDGGADLTLFTEETEERPTISSSPPQYDGVELAANLKYPQVARDNGTEGTVTIKATIDDNGHVSSTEIVESSNTIFNATVKEAVTSTEFEPALKDEQPIKGSITLKVYFELKGEGEASIRIEDVVEKETFNPEDYVDFTTEDHVPPSFSMEELASNLTYPRIAWENGIEGKVYVKVAIDKTGKIQNLSVISSTNKLFNEAALEAVKRTTFTPSILNGQFVNMYITIPVKFQLIDPEEEVTDE